MVLIGKVFDLGRSIKRMEITGYLLDAGSMSMDQRHRRREIGSEWWGLDCYEKRM